MECYNLALRITRNSFPTLDKVTVIPFLLLRMIDVFFCRCRSSGLLHFYYYALPVCLVDSTMECPTLLTEYSTPPPPPPLLETLEHQDIGAACV